MNTQTIIDLLEHLTDTWSDETIDVDSLAEIIHKSLRDDCLKSFVQEYGGCCLACAIDAYFEQSGNYILLDDCNSVSPYKMVEYFWETGKGSVFFK